MKSIGIIGSGNVAFHLGAVLKRAGFDICWVFGRNAVEVNELSKILGCIGTTELPSYEPDLALICISDDAIADVEKVLPSDWNVAYTSGMLAIYELKSSRENLGVFYPLQTFSKTREINFCDIPILVEGTNGAFADTLFQLGERISRNVHYISSEERKTIHLAAVFCNNFVNHLLYQSNEIMLDKKLDFNLLLPLLEETIRKAKSIGPKAAQTGPAKRNDQKTIEKHLSQLEGERKEIYEVITKSISETYKNA